MGELLAFPVERVRRAPSAVLPPAFFFDLGDPFSYLAAERVERELGEVEWVPVDGSAFAGPVGDHSAERLRERAEAHAAELRLPLVWPDPFPPCARGALRAAALACELGAGAAFVLAASRLAFCGGFPLDDPEIIAEAAAAAALPLRACLEAVREKSRDEDLQVVAALLREAGVRRLPAFRVADRWCEGESGLADATALLGGAESRRISGPLAPHG